MAFSIRGLVCYSTIIETGCKAGDVPASTNYSANVDGYFKEFIEVRHQSIVDMRPTNLLDHLNWFQEFL